MPDSLSALPVHQWRSEPFADELVAWLEGELGAPVRLELEKARGWAAVWRVYAGERLWWAKVNCPAQAFEAQLLALLGEVVPGRVPELVARRADGLMLMHDGGAVLRSGEADRSTDQQLATWSRVLGEWACLQRDLVPHQRRLIEAGVEAIGPSDIPDLIEEAVEEFASLPAHDVRRLAPAARTRLEAALPGIRASIEIVAGLGLPLALNHNDLHSGNAFLGRAGEPLRFFDLADAMLTDPLGVLMVPLGELAEAVGLELDGAAYAGLTDPFFEVWSDRASRRDLREALPHSLRLARVARHRTWRRVGPYLDADERARWGGAATHWLAALVDPAGE